MLPDDIRQPLVSHERRSSLLEVVLDLGAFDRRPLDCTRTLRLLSLSIWQGSISFAVACATCKCSPSCSMTGRRPEARFLGLAGGEYLREAEVCVRQLQSPVRLLLAAVRVLRCSVTCMSAATSLWALSSEPW